MQVSEQFRLHKCCVIIPTYNNAGTLEHVVRDVLKYCPDVYVVNDGSTDNTASILSSIQEIKVLTFERNRGKGTAMRKAFEIARESGFQYAITLDSDGQHFAKDLHVFLDKLPEAPNSILIGARNMQQENVPGTSSFGNKFSNFWFRFETGIEVPDTQSGYRLYPIASLAKVFLFTWRYEFEVEVLVKAAWNGIGVSTVPIDVYYPPKEERITHFRKGPDFTRISVLNTYLVTLALLWYKPKDLILNFPARVRYFWKHYFLASHESNFTKAASAGFGVFMGIIPAWGFQMLLAGFFAHLMRLNKVMAVVCSNISVPLNIPWIIYGSMKCGELLLGKHAVPFEFSKALNPQRAMHYTLQYLTGSLLFAALVGLATFLVSFLLLSLLRRNAPQTAD